MHRHHISADQLTELCAGGGSPETVRKLWEGQRSRRLLLIDTLRRTLTGSDDMGPLPPAASAWSAWEAADATAPQACEPLLLHPQVGSWAAYTLRRKRGRTTADQDLWVDAGFVHTLALVANARAGRSWRTSVPVRDGTVMLPTLGMAVLAGEKGSAVADAACAGGEIRLRVGERTVVVPADAAREADGWWPLRRLSVGEGDLRLAVFLDDVDPYRDLADPVAPDRLDDASVGRWAELLEGAWTILCREHTPTARALAVGVVSMVPLPADEWGTTRSASTGEAFASMMISPPVDAVDLAVSMVHEFQHIKLGGLLHLLPMTEHDGEAVLHAPWRDDPRPLAGLVQGVYAFFGIADFWRTRRHNASGIYRRIADFEYAYARGQVLDALASLSAVDGLTGVGRQLVHGLIERTQSWNGEELDAAAAAYAKILCDSHRAEWRLRHVRPDPRQVDALAEAWRAGAHPGHGPWRATVQSDPAAVRWSLGWQELARNHLVGRAAPGADLAALTGDLERARTEYCRAINADPRDPHAWAGLSLTATSVPLRSRPEWVRAIHVALSADVDPLTLGGWLEDASWLEGPPPPR